MGKAVSIISAVLILFLYAGCRKTDLSQTAGLKFGKILVFGHAGAGMGIVNTPNPPNSEESILSAIDFHGADGVEVDIQILKDSNILIYHDIDLRTQTNCTGCLKEKNLADIEQCQFRRAFMATENGSTLVALEKMILHFAAYPVKPKMSLNVHLHYDCLPYEQWSDYDKAFTHELDRLIKEANGMDWIWIESESVEFLKQLHALDSGLRTFLIQPISDASIQSALNAGCFGLVCSLSETTATDVQKARNQELLVSIYNANIRKDIKKAIEMLPDCIQTDNIILTKQLLQP